MPQVEFWNRPLTGEDEPAESRSILGEHRSRGWKAVDPSCPPQITARIAERRTSVLNRGSELPADVYVAQAMNRLAAIEI